MGQWKRKWKLLLGLESKGLGLEGFRAIGVGIKEWNSKWIYYFRALGPFEGDINICRLVSRE